MPGIRTGTSRVSNGPLTQLTTAAVCVFCAVIPFASLLATPTGRDPAIVYPLLALICWIIGCWGLSYASYKVRDRVYPVFTTACVIAGVVQTIRAVVL